MPSNCAAGAVPTKLSANSWYDPMVFKTASFSADENGTPTAVTECDSVRFDPRIDAAQTTDQVTTPTGLDFELDLPTGGLLNPKGRAQAQVKRAVVTLPEGTTLNPSAAEGLSACTPAELERETAASNPGDGCPNGSRLGSVDVETPLSKSI